MLSREDPRFWLRCPHCQSDNSAPTLSPVNGIRLAINGFGRALQLLEAAFGYVAWIYEWPFGGDREELHVPSPLVGLRRRCKACGARFLGGSAARADPMCGQCGYNLTGNTSGVCPECGWQLPRIMQVLLYYEARARRHRAGAAGATGVPKGASSRSGKSRSTRR
jgi:hypothetical protein